MKNRKITLAPSLLAADFSKIGEQIKILEEAQVPYLHLDVMDGAFVPNISFGQPLIKSIRKVTEMFFDVHLMINNPERYIKSFADSGADLITIHFESTDKVSETLKEIRTLGKKAGLYIKPKTSPEAIKDLLPLCDLVLVMTVEPGFGGQKLISETLDSIRAVKGMRDEAGLSFEIEADGGIGADNVKAVYDAGAEVIVAGSSVLGRPDIKAAAEAIYSALED